MEGMRQAAENAVSQDRGDYSAGISGVLTTQVLNRSRTFSSTNTMVMMMMMWSLMSSDVGLTYQGQTVTNACAWFSVALHVHRNHKA